MSANDRIQEIEQKLEKDDISSHKRDKLKRELNKLKSRQNESGIGAYRTVGIAVLAIALVVGAGYALSAAGIVQLEMNGSPTGNAGNEPIDPSQISTEDEPVLGEEDAPVTIVAYEDFQCPICQQFDNGVFEQLKTEYVDTGKAKIVWKDFPLSQIHDWASPAANTMECVYRQDNDAFWAVKSKVFDNQGQLSVSNVQSKILNWAEEEGVAKSDVRACIKNDNPQSEVQQDYNEGTSVGVRGTPTVFIEGQPIRGLSGYNQYKQIIESELQNESQ